MFSRFRAEKPTLAPPAERPGKTAYGGVPRAAKSKAKDDGFMESLKAAMREAVRSELLEFFQNPDGLAPDVDLLLGQADEPQEVNSLCRLGHVQTGSSLPIKEESCQSSDVLGSEGLRDVEDRTLTTPATPMPEAYDEMEGGSIVNHRGLHKLRRRKMLRDKSASVQILSSAYLVSIFTAMGSLVEPERKGKLATLVQSAYFEQLVQAIIIINLAVMAFAVNYEVQNWDKPTSWIDLLEIPFLAFYTIELLLKIAVHRAYFFWNEDMGFGILDVLIVVSGYLDFLLSATHTAGAAASFRFVRILKLGKALRALRVISAIGQLRAVLTCIRGSLATFCWSLLMLITVFFMFSLLFVQSVALHFKDLGDDFDSQDKDVQDLSRLYGSVPKSMLTLYLATVGGENWTKSFDTLSQCGWVSACCFIVFMAFVQLALINIITGIFVDAAMQTLAPDRKALAAASDLQESMHAEELQRLCIALDDNGDGMINEQQLHKVLAKEDTLLLLRVLGLPVHHVHKYFHQLCNGDVEKDVDISKFIDGCMHRRESATNFDLQLLFGQMREMHQKQQNELQALRALLLRSSAIRTRPGSVIRPGLPAGPSQA